MTTRIDHPDVNDNRAYDYSGHADELREEYATIAALVEPGARVIDLGCGNGTLLQLLRDERNATGLGIDISASGVAATAKRGIEARQGRIDEHLDLPDDSFDYAICNVTMQMVEYPEVLLSEMKRIARKQIISFPNFGFYRNRLDLLFNGRMPRPTLFGYRWYNTGHIHQFSYADFRELIGEVGGLTVETRTAPPPKSMIRKILSALAPDLFQMVIIVLLRADR